MTTPTYGSVYFPAASITPRVLPTGDDQIAVDLHQQPGVSGRITGTAAEIVAALEDSIAAVLKWTNENPPPPKLPLTEFAVVPDRFASTHGSDAA